MHIDFPIHETILRLIVFAVYVSYTDYTTVAFVAFSICDGILATYYATIIDVRCVVLNE